MSPMNGSQCSLRCLRAVHSTSRSVASHWAIVPALGGRPRGRSRAAASGAPRHPGESPRSRRLGRARKYAAGQGVPGRRRWAWPACPGDSAGGWQRLLLSTPGSGCWPRRRADRSHAQVPRRHAVVAPQGPAAGDAVGLPTGDADHAEQRQEHHQVITASERAPTVVAYTPLQEGAGRGRTIMACNCRHLPNT
jgi:hypothetical protein